MKRSLEGNLGKVVFVLAAMFGLTFFYISGFGLRWRPTEANLAFFLFFTFALSFLIYAPSKKLTTNKPALIVDCCLAVITCSAVIYWLFTFATYAATRVGNPTQLDLICGAIVIVASLEIARRALGNILAGLGIVFLLTLYFGPHLPDIFAHRGFSVVRIIEFLACGTGGIYGSITSTFATFIMPFMVFGAFLQKSGGAEFFVDISKALAGRIAGGSALMSIGTTGLFGTVSGSPIAVVMAVGPFCVPMMKKAGYDSNYAGAVMASAATGAQFLPPVMGAGAFILATLTEVPYSTILVMALVPALFFYMSLVAQTYFHAKRIGLSGLKPEEQLKLSDVLKKGWYFIFVLVGCTVLIAVGYSIPLMAFWATIIIIACGMVRKETRFTPKKFFETCAIAGRDSLIVGATAGTIGIIMGSISLSGMGIQFSAAILSLSQGHLFTSLILVIFISLIVGLGLPTTAAYIILAILAAPALIRLGIEPVYAHLLVFWLSMASNVTPPVCVAAFAGAGVAGGDPMRTGMKAFVLSIYLYLMAFAFVYAPQITLVGFDVFPVVEIIISWAFATIALAAAVQGWYIKNLNILERLVILAATVFLAIPGIFSSLIGAGILLAVTLIIRSSNKNKSVYTNIN